MASNDLKMAAQKELLRRKAAEELARRRGQTNDAPNNDYWGTSNTAMDFMLAGLPSKFNAGMSSLIEGTASGLTGNGFDYATPYNEALEFQRGAQKDFEAENPGKAALGKAVGLGAGVAMLPGIGQGVKGAIGTGAVYGGATGALQDADSLKERAQNTMYGGATGAAVGGLLAGGAAALNKIRQPFQTSRETQKLARVLEKEGVDLTAGQKTNSERLRYYEAELGGAKAANMMEKQAEQFTAAALKRAGIKSNRATPEVIDKAFTSIGKEFDDLAVRNPLRPDTQLMNDLTAVVDDYQSLLGQNAAPVISGTRDAIKNFMKSGAMTGEQFKTMRSDLASKARATTSPELKIALNDLIEVLDDGMKRNIAQLNPADVGKWENVRRLYRNMMVIEQAATGAGQNAAQGLISPSQLRNATIQKQTRRAYARGKGEFASLARAGEGLLKALPQSGTAPRTFARNVGAGLPTLIGSVAGSPAGAGGMLAGGLLGMVAPRVAGAGLMSRPVQAYLSRRGGAAISPEIARRLAAEGGLLGADALLGSP